MVDPVAHPATRTINGENSPPIQFGYKRRVAKSFTRTARYHYNRGARSDLQHPYSHLWLSKLNVVDVRIEVIMLQHSGFGIFSSLNLGIIPIQRDCYILHFTSLPPLITRAVS